MRQRSSSSAVSQSENPALLGLMGLEDTRRGSPEMGLAVGLEPMVAKRQT